MEFKGQIIALTQRDNGDFDIVGTGEPSRFYCDAKYRNGADVSDHVHFQYLHNPNAGRYEVEWYIQVDKRAGE